MLILCVLDLWSDSLFDVLFLYYIPVFIINMWSNPPVQLHIQEMEFAFVTPSHSFVCMSLAQTNGSELKQYHRIYIGGLSVRDSVRP